MMKMYQVMIKTKFNTINLKVDDINSKEFKEIVEQDYVVEVKIERIKTKEELIEERDNLLYNVVGMSYNTEKALELNKKIKEG